jgi:D-alanyl-D-alanine dipeptidase
MAQKLWSAQESARASGETLVIYEAYRPYDVQMTIVRALQKLANADRTVMAGISTAPWALSWFTSTRLSNHQRGGAVDISLAKVTKTEEKRAGAYGYADVTGAEVYDMPTKMHELSEAAVAFTAPVSGSSRTAWKTATLSRKMNAPAKRLQKYLTDAGLTPLASEWWHFNDLDALELTSANMSTGRYVLSGVVSEAP